jgi:hypothetical protein
MIAALDLAHRARGEGHADLPAARFEIIDQFFVLDVEGQRFMTGEIHTTVRLARQCPITTRQRTPEVQVFDIFLAVKAVVSRQAGSRKLNCLEKM